MKWRLGFVLLLLLTVMLAGFWLTGGSGLVSLYRNYLSQDIPDKKYSRQNFTERGTAEPISGYYAGSIGNSLWIWTLSGLKRYQHRDGTSVYRYVDVCQKMRDFAAQLAKSESGGEIREILDINPVFTMQEWLYMVKRGDYVAVRYIDEGGVKIVDKLHSSSNQHYPLETLRVEQCQD